MLYCTWVILGLAVLCNFFSKLTRFDSLTNHILKFYSSMQYMVFFMLYTTVFPPAADDLLKQVYDGTVGLRSLTDSFFRTPILHQFDAAKDVNLKVTPSQADQP